jgi:hypothetical protein
MLAAPATRYLSPDRRLDWRGEDYGRRHGSLDARLAFLGRFTKALADGGVPLVVGTDGPSIPGIAPGFSVHDDLDRLVAAGLTHRQALTAATRTPGEFVWKYVPLRKPLGVMAAGRWRARPALEALLDTVAKQYDSVCGNAGR